MSDADPVNSYYTTLADQELLKLWAEGGLTPEAGRSLSRELASRGLACDEAERLFAPKWLDTLDACSIGVIALRDGEQITVEVIGLNDDGDALAVNVISPATHPQNGRRNHRTIPLSEIIAFEPQPTLKRRLSYSDPCLDRTFSPPRFLLMTTIAICSIAGSLAVYDLTEGRPHGLQETSIFAYTSFALFFTFARTGNGVGPVFPPVKFTCPAVWPQFPRLLLRHLGFLIALIALQTAMLAVRPHLPGWWNSPDLKGHTPFGSVLLLLCTGLGFVQVCSNRTLLKRAHRASPGNSR